MYKVFLVYVCVLTGYWYRRFVHCLIMRANPSIILRKPAFGISVAIFFARFVRTSSGHSRTSIISRHTLPSFRHVLSIHLLLLPPSMTRCLSYSLPVDVFSLHYTLLPFGVVPVYSTPGTGCMDTGCNDKEYWRRELPGSPYKPQELCS